MPAFCAFGGHVPQRILRASSQNPPFRWLRAKLRSDSKSERLLYRVEEPMKYFASNLGTFLLNQLPPEMAHTIGIRALRMGFVNPFATLLRIGENMLGPAV